jgi:hypothetical protein
MFASVDADEYVSAPKFAWQKLSSVPSRTNLGNRRKGDRLNTVDRVSFEPTFFE